MNLDRRRFLSGAGVVAVGMTAIAARGQTKAACYNPAALTLSQQRQRRAVEYHDVSPDPNKHCGLCSFFVQGASGCGACQLLANAPVSANGLCSSFAAKAL